MLLSRRICLSAPVRPDCFCAISIALRHTLSHRTSCAMGHDAEQTRNLSQDLRKGREARLQGRSCRYVRPPLDQTRPGGGRFTGLLPTNS